LTAISEFVDSPAMRQRTSVLLDNCQAHGIVDTVNEAAAWSFYATKLVRCGEGGMITTDIEYIASECMRLRDHDSDGTRGLVGWNARMTEIQAILGLESLNRLDDEIEHRKIQALVYGAGLHGIDGISIPEVTPNWNGYLYTIRVHDDRRDALKAWLLQGEVETGVYYPTLVLRLKDMQQIPLSGLLPNASQATREVLSLPIGSHVEHEQVAAISAQIRDFFDQED